MLLVKESEPVPSEVFVARSTVGFAVVLQQTPLAVIGDPPSDVIFPPLEAEVLVIEAGLLVDGEEDRCLFWIQRTL